MDLESREYAHQINIDTYGAQYVFSFYGMKEAIIITLTKFFKGD